MGMVLPKCHFCNSSTHNAILVIIFWGLGIIFGIGHFFVCPQGVKRTAQTKREERQQEKELLAQGIMPESLKSWKVRACPHSLYFGAWSA